MSDTLKYCTDPDNCTFGDCPSAFCDRDKKTFPVSDTPRTDAATWHTRTPGDPIGASVVYRSFAEGVERELTAAQAEIARLKAGGCARDQRTTQFCAEAVKLQERVNLLDRLVDGVHYIDGVHLEEIDGLNWFDARKKAKDTQ